MTSTPTTAAAEQPDQSRPSAVGGPGLLAVDGHELELPRTPATDGADGLGVSKLLGSTGVVTLDPGFTNTASFHGPTADDRIGRSARISPPGAAAGYPPRLDKLIKPVAH